MGFNKEQKTLAVTLLILILALIGLVYEGVNFATTSIIIHFLLVGFAVMVLLNWQNIERTLKPVARKKKYDFVGADVSDWRHDIAIGIFVMLGFVFVLNNIPSLSMALPHQELAIVDYAYMVIFWGPIIEEIVFRGAIFNILLYTMKKEYAFLAQAGIFAVFHWSAYGVSYGNVGALSGSVFFALVTASVLLAVSNLFSAFVIHMGVNFFIFQTDEKIPQVVTMSTMWSIMYICLFIGVGLLIWHHLSKK